MLERPEESDDSVGDLREKSKHPKLGRTAYKLEVYKKRTAARLDDLKSRMNAARAKGDLEWLKLRKQFLAQKSRVKKRIQIANSSDEYQKRERMLKDALQIVKNNISSDTYHQVMHECFQ